MTTPEGQPTNGRPDILHDHRRVGRKFIPKMALDSNTTALPWNDVLPEYVWIAVLQHHFGYQRAAQLVVALLKSTTCVPQEHVEADESQPWLRPAASWFSKRSADELENIKSTISKEDLNYLSVGLATIARLYDAFPLRFLVDESDVMSLDPNFALSAMSKSLAGVLDRKSKSATYMQTTVLYASVITDFLKVADKNFLDALESIEGYPDKEESLGASAVVRASITGFSLHAHHVEWPTVFWRSGFTLSPCDAARSGSPPTDETLEQWATFEKLSRAFSRELPSQLSQVVSAVDPDLYRPQRFEVLTGLLARECRFACAITRTPQLWSSDLGRVVLRCMVDSLITLKWLSKLGTKDDIRSFIEHGLGQEKLMLEHLKASTPLSGDEEKQAHNDIEDWINSQLYTFMLPVDLGGWKNVRTMAEQIGELDTYNLQFSPLSSSVHGSWNAIARVNLMTCFNPLHGVHRVPDFDQPDLDLDLVFLGVEIFAEAYSAWTASFGVEPDDLACVGKFEKDAADVLARH